MQELVMAIIGFFMCLLMDIESWILLHFPWWSSFLFFILIYLFFHKILPKRAKPLFSIALQRLIIVFLLFIATVL